jgi:hypothetical protein
MLGPAPGANGLSSPKKHQPTLLADSRNHNKNARSSSSDSTTDWRYDGSSFVIYIETSDTVFPWVVWADIPVSLLIPAVVNLLTRSHQFVPPESVTLLHHGRVMDAVHGCLSDYPVLTDDVVTVQYTFPRGGLVVDRTVPGKSASASPPSRSRPTSKPQPTREGNEMARGEDKGEGGMDGLIEFLPLPVKSNLVYFGTGN